MPSKRRSDRDELYMRARAWFLSKGPADPRSGLSKPLDAQCSLRGLGTQGALARRARTYLRRPNGILFQIFSRGNYADRRADRFSRAGMGSLVSRLWLIPVPAVSPDQGDLAAAASTCKRLHTTTAARRKRPQRAFLVGRRPECPTRIPRTLKAHADAKITCMLMSTARAGYQAGS